MRKLDIETLNHVVDMRCTHRVTLCMHQHWCLIFITKAEVPMRNKCSYGEDKERVCQTPPVACNLLHFSSDNHSTRLIRWRLLEEPVKTIHCRAILDTSRARHKDASQKCQI